MKKIKLNLLNSFLLIQLIIIGCSTPSIIKSKAATDKEKLTHFFTICENDIKNAVRVINSEKIADNLTHLLTMNTGGQRYYILERKNISKMISSVTKNSYSDLILINSKGTIVYTMINNDLFGKNVKTHYKNSALHKCFRESRKKSLHVNDMSVSPWGSGNKIILISFPLAGKSSEKGVFIIQINPEIIKSVFDKNNIIIGMDGKYRIDNNPENILTEFPCYNKTLFSGLTKKNAIKISCTNQVYTCQRFKFNKLDWIIMQ